ncbi:WxL domain-containing protein [Lactiplantibacillus daowaiensis]|uniref:WxL domain-containing protein n=1 Tax=Lactiplantibacillus daowaiensis TaxID=2559918 RepID=A0ABW1S1G7_9LACO|nr:WxL domain-containing protein [Lactiplantibacillus daowaiensis]
MSKLLKAVLLSSALLLSLSAPVKSHAADTTPSPDASSDSGSAPASENRSGKTTVHASFTQGDKNINPIDPAHPDNDTTTIANNGAQAGGGLSLVYITNVLDFGSHPLDILHDQSYPANYQDPNKRDNNANTDALLNGKAVVEVSDVRGTNAGWQLSVNGEPLKGTDGTTIDGATLSVNNGSVSTPLKTSETNGVNLSKVTNALAASSTPLLTAPMNKGAGLTIAQVDPSDIKLNIPANQAKSQGYDTTVTWNLGDLPKN